MSKSEPGTDVGAGDGEDLPLFPRWRLRFEVFFDYTHRIALFLIFFFR